jgi:hypothetical protein
MASQAMSRDEALLPLRKTSNGVVPPATHVRSTLIASSVLAIRERNHFDAYLTHLPEAMRGPVLDSVAGSWLPIDVAHAHYRAAQAMLLPVQEQFEIGKVVAIRIQNSLLGTLVRLAKGAGVTPWLGLEQFQRLWDRLLQGGGGAVYRLGPKEARVEVHGVSLVQYPYFKNAWRGMFAGSGSLFCNKLYISEIPQYASPTSLAFRIAWA